MSFFARPAAVSVRCLAQHGQSKATISRCTMPEVHIKPFETHHTRDVSGALCIAITSRVIERRHRVRRIR
jgi:hypothetical protein